MIKSSYFILVLIHFQILIFISLQGISAEPKHLQFKHLTSDDGLSSSVVTAIIQDHKGFVWIGTDNGLNRYDGFNFTVYNNNIADSTSLENNSILTMFEDSKYNLFVGTQLRSFLPEE